MNPDDLFCEWLRSLKKETPEDRVAIFDQLRDNFCFYCGNEQDEIGRKCQCWNDE